MASQTPNRDGSAGGRMIRRAMSAPMLSREKEAALARRWVEKQDQAAFQELVSSHSRLVIAMASKYRGYGLPLADLIQEGHVGLLQAVSRFDPGKEVRLATYAMWWIKAALTDFVLRNWSIVRLGSSATEKSLFFKLRGLKSKILAPGEETLSDEERERLAKVLSADPRNIARMEMRLAGRDPSVNTPVGAEGDGEFQDLLVDERPTPEDIVTARHDGRVRSKWLARAMDQLPQREALIIRERHLSETGVTLEDLGQRLGVSKERVRQLEGRALATLKGLAEQGI